ncbi:MAG TPA: DUF924 family protein [Ramlibacter sp.]|jgi:uncharacterized protein (DUF924 family)|uniref:DUF924 family protein n=1 Tax=Ramlibacter sp. TaxID=1917967 RepID=UPI002D6CFE11|nr:DUF924 family protein [Ramlibacter sp.]HZY18394.1 DUF924 family protein [Ramlibacter sp.]
MDATCSTPLPSAATDVLAFWAEAGRARWFRKDEAFDRAFRERFLAAHEEAARGALDGWAGTPDGALALLILLDQFPRNAFRGSARMFATDALARVVAERAIAAGHDAALPDHDLRNFVYLPLMHSEWLPDQDRALQLCSALANDASRHAGIHRDIVARFGRFPHRNALLGRRTTAQEQAFLDGGGFAG